MHTGLFEAGAERTEPIGVSIARGRQPENVCSLAPRSRRDDLRPEDGWAEWIWKGTEC